MIKKVLAVLLVLTLFLTTLSCTSTDPMTEPVYYTDLWVLNSTGNWTLLTGDTIICSNCSGGASNLSELEDVNIPSPDDLDVLTYDSGTGTWVSSPCSGGSNCTCNLTDIQNQIDSITSDISDLQSNITSLSNTVVLQGGNISNLLEDVSDLQGDVSDIQGDLSSLNITVSGLVGDVDNLQEDVSDLQGDMSDLQGLVTGLNETVTSILGDISDIQGDISDLQGDVSDLQAKSHDQNTDTNLGTLDTKNPPIDNDLVVQRDSTNSSSLFTSTWTQVKSFLKSFFDTIYATLTDFLALNATVEAQGDDIDLLQGNMTDAQGDITDLQGDMTVVQGNITDLANDKISQGGPLTANLDFASYMAVAMVCDKGTIIPLSPVAGQWFLHTPTGRIVLLLYSGSAWIPMMSMGNTIVYVDKTDGTDAMDKGGSVDAGAFKTVQYAIDTIPGVLTGNVTININNEAYAESVIVSGKTFTSNFRITLIGILGSPTNLVATGAGQKGAGATFPTFVLTGMTVNAYQDKLIKFTSGTNNGLWRIVDSNTATTITMLGTTLNAAPAAADTASIYDWSTSLTSLTITNGQQAVYVEDIAISTTSVSSVISMTSKATFTRVKSYGQVAVVQGSSFWAYQFLSLGVSTYRLYINTQAYVFLQGCKLYCATSGAQLIACGVYSALYLQEGNVLDGSVAGGSDIGINMEGMSLGVCYCWQVNNIIRGLYYGIYAQQASECIYTLTNTNTCTAPETAIGVETHSWSYID